MSSKSSQDILAELFGAFNAQPPATIDLTDDEHTKHKKSKKSKKKHKKKKKVRVKAEKDESGGPMQPEDNDSSSDKSTSIKIKQEPPDDEGPRQHKSNNIDEAFEKPEEPLVDEEKTRKKTIYLPNLKQSTVYQDTMKAVAEKEKQKQEKRQRYEEGEISSSERDSEEENDHMEERGKRRNSHSDPHRVKRQKRGFCEYELMLRDEISRRRRSSRSPHLRKEGRSLERSIYHRERSRSRERMQYKEKSRQRSKERMRSRCREREKLRPKSKDRELKEREKSRDKLREKSKEKLEAKEKCKDTEKAQKEKEKLRDRSKERERIREKSKEKEKSKSKRRSKEKSVEKERHRARSRSVSIVRSTKNGLIFDKERLLAIAKKNAKKLIQHGILPADQLKSISGKTVEELTDYCKKLSKKEALGDDFSDLSSGSDDESRSFHHPFLVRDRPCPIIMNIRNAINLPVRTLQEKTLEETKQLRLQFPVSSGSSHRKTESEWVPVEPQLPKKLALPAPEVPLAIMAPPTAPVRAASPPPATCQQSLHAVPPPAILQLQIPVIQPCSSSSETLAIENSVVQSINLIRRRQEEVIRESGAFTGSTGARILSVDQLATGQQAWAKRDQLISAQPVSGGMGMTLLQKMGWQPGQGLGKNKEGTLEPLRLEVKFDRKGLVAPEEGMKCGRKTLPIAGPPIPTVKTLDGKHPVSLLNELCSRRKWGPPVFDLAAESGPDHQKNFLFKVKVNGMEYTPLVASNNKKQAKAEAAAICLSALGIITKSITSQT